MFFMKPKAECSPADVQQALSDPDCVVIDCRTPGEVAGGTVSGALVRDWMGGEFQAKAGSWILPRLTTSIAAAATAVDRLRPF